MSTKLKYPYNWARSVSQAFFEGYARGAYNLSRLLDMPYGEVRYQCTLTLARGNSLKWEVIKRTIKYLHMDKFGDLRGLHQEAQILLIKCLRIMAEDDALDQKKASLLLDELNQYRLDL